MTPSRNAPRQRPPRLRKTEALANKLLAAQREALVTLSRRMEISMISLDAQI